jgi:hypothetical protein
VHSHTNISSANLEALEKYLAQHYNAYAVQYMSSIVAIHYDDDSSSYQSDQRHIRPFSIAGLVAIWRPYKGYFNPFVWRIGELGHGEDVEIPAEYAQQLQQSTTLPKTVVCFFANTLFPNCTAVAYMFRCVVVELPKMTAEDFSQRLSHLPWGFKGYGPPLFYHNGPIRNTELARPRRTTKPRPVREVLERATKKLDDEEPVEDHTDYVKRDQKFYPGTLLCSIKSAGPNQGQVDTLVAAGVLVKKDGQKRLTCSFHAWQSQNSAHPGAFGLDCAASRDIFQVVQGMTDGDQPGTRVGWVCKSFGDSNVALAQLDNGINFENQFFDVLDTNPKVFLRLRDIKIGDDFLVESYASGRQRLRCAGVWNGIESAKPGPKSLRQRERQPGQFVSKGGLPVPHETERYVMCEQTVFLTNKGEEVVKPCIPSGSYGSVLVRCKSETQDVLDKGEVGGILHWSNIQVRGSSLHFLFADSFDPLIADGWEVDKFEDENAENDADPALERPSKKRKTATD